MSALKDRLVRAWVEDLSGRLPIGHRIYAMRRPERVRPPFSVLTVMRMEQTTPGANVWRADVKAVVVCDRKDEGTAEQEQRTAELYAALEETTVPGVDAGKGVVLYGFSIDEIAEAKAAQVYSDVIFITAGVGGGG